MSVGGPRHALAVACLALLACGGVQGGTETPDHDRDVQAAWHELNGACLGPLPPSVRLESHGVVAEGVNGEVSFAIREVAVIDRRGPEHPTTIQISSLGTASEDEVSARFQGFWRRPAGSLVRRDGGTVAQHTLRGGVAWTATHCLTNGQLHIIGFVAPDSDPVIRDRYVSRLRPCPCTQYAGGAD
jgi:hypothetical protein